MRLRPSAMEDMMQESSAPPPRLVRRSESRVSGKELAALTLKVSEGSSLFRPIQYIQISRLPGSSLPNSPRATLPPCPSPSSATPPPIPATPDQATLERVPAPARDRRYLVRFTAPEFTSLCPITGQPDFAHIVIDYVPAAWLVESKSLKLYLASFRNHGAFHEAATMQIAGALMDLLTPVWLRHRRLLLSPPAAVYRSMSSGRATRRPRVCGCPSRGFRPIAGAANLSA